MKTIPTAGAPVRLLLVEDNPGDARLQREELATAATLVFDVTHAARLDAALAVLASETFDVVLLDLNLPDSSGLATFQAAARAAVNLPIVVLSGLADETIGAEAVHSGAQDYLVKGQIPPGMLERTLRYALERSRAIAALRESDERYRRFFTEDLAGAFIASPDGMLLTCNPSFARMFGFPDVETALERSVVSYFGSGEAALALRRRVGAEKRLSDHEFVLHGFEGRRLDVVGNLVGGFSPDGTLVEIKGYLLDNTQRRQLEESLRQSQKMESVGRLAGGIAHDFNNLLTAILGYTELLRSHIDADDPRSREVDEIARAGERAAELTRQLLAFSRRQILQTRDVDLAATVLEMKTLFEHLFGTNIALITDLAPDLGTVTADPSQVEQVIMNLALNARDAMPSGGRLVIRTRRASAEDPRIAPPAGLAPGDYAVLAVEDSGHGIDPAIRPQIFEPFFTTKDVGKGTGLGLSTVYGIVKQSGGDVTVESEVGKGSIFRVFLRLSGRPAAAATARTVEQPAPGSETILLVEDEASVRSIARQMLEAGGYRVLEADGGAAALVLCRENEERIDLVLTDSMMPAMSGQELASHLAQLYPSLPILFMSGYSKDSLGRDQLGRPDVAFLEKPFSGATLLGKVRATIDASRSSAGTGTSASPVVEPRLVAAAR